MIVSNMFCKIILQTERCEIVNLFPLSFHSTVGKEQYTVDVVWYGLWSIYPARLTYI